MGALNDTSHLPAAQASFRVAGTAAGGTVTYPSGGTTVSWHLAADDTYVDWETMALAVQTAIRAATGSTQWIFELVAYGETGFRLRRGDGNAFDATFTEALSDFTGLVDTSIATSITSATPPPYGYYPPLPVTDDDVVYRWVRSVSNADGGRPVAVLHGRQTEFAGELHFNAATVARLRTFLDYVSHGVPFCLFLDRANTEPWAEDERTGVLYLSLPPTQSRAERWWTEPSKCFGSVKLKAYVLEW